LIPFPDKKYKIIYADPPWEYGSYSNMGDSRKVKRLGITPKFKITPYNGMKLDDIKKLPINSISDKDSILFLWVTFPNLKDGLEVIDSWGFEYRTIGFNWVKKNKNGVGWFIGLGNYTRANSEVCLIARKGKGIPIISKTIEQIIDLPLTEHSEKPDEVRKRIVQLCGDLPRIELFARTKVHGWDVWGNDEKLQLKPLEEYNFG
jgi:N6-adenosine-specific RNA methylase IME4